MSTTTTLGDVERLCWTLSGWQVEQRAVDELLAAVQAYAGSQRSGDGAPWSDGGTGEPERPSEALAPPVAAPEPPAVLSGSHSGVQGLHVTGTITLVCQAACPHTSPVPAPVVPEGHKLCSTCRQAKPQAAFTTDPKAPSGLRYACKPCENKRKREGRRRLKREREAA